MSMNNEEKETTFYEGRIAQTYDRQRFDTAAGQLIHFTEWKMLRKAVGGYSDGIKILEVGCGTGRFIEELVKLKHEPEGMDPSEDMLEVCRKKLGESQAFFRRGEADQLPYGEGQFDFVYSIRVMNQVESVDYAHRAIAEMLRVTKPGGRVLIEYMDRRRSKFARRKVRLGKEWVNRRVDSDTRLDGSHLEKMVVDAGARVEWRRGVFFLGMTSYYAAPKPLLSLVGGLDRLLSRCFPSLCSRCYLLIRKGN